MARNGRPAIRCGFQSGMSGSAARENSKKGWNTATASASSKLAPSGLTPGGVNAVQGVIVQLPSELESVRSGSSPWPTNTSDSSA